MSRSGYDEDFGDGLELGRWRAQVESATRGKRGQRFFFDLVTALDNMPEKKLISGELEEDGAVCALGALGKYRGVDLASLNIRDWEDGDWEKLGGAFNIASQLAQETMYVNDDQESCFHTLTSAEQRWLRVREWALLQLKPETLVPEELSP